MCAYFNTENRIIAVKTIQNVINKSMEGVHGPSRRVACRAKRTHLSVHCWPMKMAVA